MTQVMLSHGPLGVTVRETVVRVLRGLQENVAGRDGTLGTIRVSSMFRDSHAQNLTLVSNRIDINLLSIFDEF